MLDDAALGQFDVIVTHTLDRWSRNLKVMLESLSVLGSHGVGYVSIVENVDYTTPHGKLTTQLLGGMAEFFSDMLAVHTKKGIDERARQGRHLGSIPFGYESCWITLGGEKALRCNPEHPGGIHVHPTEGQAVTDLFKRYATGTVSLSILAASLNESAFRTRNTKPLPDTHGNLVASPRLFTTASVRGILHNPFFTGKVRHKDKLLSGLHQPLVTSELFDEVQVTMKKNSGRSQTLQAHPEREYLLKGLIRCSYCEMPMWAQTYQNGNRYYREHRGSRGAGSCVNSSGSIACHLPDKQVSELVRAIVLPEAWLDRVLAKIHLEDEVSRVGREKRKVEKQLQKLGQVYLDDDLMEYDEYKRRKRRLEDRLVSLVVPGVDSAVEAGKLLESLPKLWHESDLKEKHKVLVTMLDAVYVDCKDRRRIVSIRPKPAFRPLFEVASTREGSKVVLVNENDSEKEKASSDDEDALPNTPCSWWRRGRVELPPEQLFEVRIAA